LMSSMDTTNLGLKAIVSRQTTQPTRTTTKAIK
jgi:hypothetical protein